MSELKIQLSFFANDKELTIKAFAGRDTWSISKKFSSGMGDDQNFIYDRIIQDMIIRLLHGSGGIEAVRENMNQKGEQKCGN